MSDIAAILIAAGLTLLGLVLAYASKRINLITESPLLVVLVLLPLALFLAFSGRIAEISGGGFKITLAKVKATSVATVTTRDVVARCTNPPLNAVAVSFVPGCAYVVLKADYGEASEADAKKKAWVLAHYIQNALKYGGFRLLIVTDAEGRPLGHFGRDAFLDLLPVQFEQIADDNTAPLAMSRQQANFLIRQSILFGIVRYPRLKAKDAPQTRLHPGDNLVEALAVLNKHKLAAAPVVDRNGRLMGIAAREDVVAAMLLTLAGAKP